MKTFEYPEIEVLLLSVMDVITASYDLVLGEDETPTIPGGRGL